MSEIEALEKAIKICGGQTMLANKVGTKQGNVWYWLKKKNRVHADFVLKVEIATGSEVTRHELRPDLYPKDEAAA